MNEFNAIWEIEERLSTLPRGYISQKRIGGKTRYYLQWKENGKVKSQYIPLELLEETKAQIEERRRLQEQMKEWKVKNGKERFFETNVVICDELDAMTKSVSGLKKRDMYDRILSYLYGKVRNRVCVLYGLRRTGKTTMLLQAIAEMKKEDFVRSAYIKLRMTNSMDQLTRDLDRLYQAGYRYIFLDEVTLMKDFIDCAALLSDVYVPMGMRIVLSGTDSLGFWLASDNELYDRERTFHTTFIPYREYSRLLGIDSIDEYIRYGGTLRAGEVDFDDEDLQEEGIAFRDDESTRRYIDTAICKNIQHSLANLEFGQYFGHLRDLYEANELTGAINRIVEDMNHEFVVRVLTRPFLSHDLRITARNLKRERNPERRMNILNEMDQASVTASLMKILEIRNQEEQKIGITKSHGAQIKKYLEALDLIVSCPIEYGLPDVEAQERVLFTQPGMRYCQAQALVYTLMKDERFQQLDYDTISFVTERLLQEVRGRMLEDIVLLETMKALGKNYKVFKLMFASGEFDMVVLNQKEGRCAIYEIKHSQQCVFEQARHLRDEEKLRLTTPRFGKLAGRYVLYLGQDMDTDDGIRYRNVETFLKNLPTFSFEK
ncbi:AAA family ATPase [uncultured Dubosiella sp.]|uniref:AAA family ATPase n=1 Tax=uncultured Dubosiella sp. TaxID=1937011 RepID=UPI00272F7893|nr:AAA family ATPase [uncultured Dubosiella sp.]